MIQRFRNYIAPITIDDDPEQTRIHALLNRLLLTLIFIAGVFIFISPFIFQGNFHVAILFVILTGIWFLARSFAKMGKLRYLNIGIVIILWILTTGLIYISGGLKGTPFALNYIAVVVIAGRLLGGRGGIIAMLLSFASLILVFYLGQMERLPLPASDTNELDVVLLIAINLVVVTIFQYLAWRGEQEAFKKERALAKEAIAANEYKTNLLARVSHELRTPLAAVLGLSDMLRTGPVGDVSKEQESILLKIENNAKYLKTLIDELLEQSQLFLSTLILIQDPFSPSKLVQQVKEVFEPVAAEKGIKVRFEGTDCLPETLVGDSERTIEIFFRLINNAIKNTENGEVLVSTRMLNDDHWQVMIRDTGVGIAPEHIDRIFEPFIQLQDSIITRFQSGVGLGLSIAKDLVEMMGGIISVESELGVGSTFTVILPVVTVKGSEL